MSDDAVRDEAARLEALWGGEFGREYVDRNADAGNVREPFWEEMLGRIETTSARSEERRVGKECRL